MKYRCFLRAGIPLLFFLISLMYWALRDRIIPPIGENFLIFCILGLFVRMVSEPYPRGWNHTLIFLIGILTILASLGYIYIFYIQKDMTERQVKTVINELNLDDKKKDTIINIGLKIIDPDFIENSSTNKFSNYERKERRDDYAEMINTEITNGKLKGENFLVPERSSHWTVTLHKIIFIYSLIAFALTIIFNYKLFFKNEDKNSS